jgi:HAD superfamily hydrolase (TIGR01509 family)
MPVAVIFDLDGVLVDSEQLWNRAKEEYVRATGGQWRDDAPEAMIGMSSPEWSAYIHDELRVDRPATEINQAVVQRIEELYRAELPLLPGAVDTVRAMQRSWPLGLASSSNREIIDLVIEEAGLTGAFVATVSSEEVARGKPSPDVYLEAARRMGVDPHRCVAVEDSANGLRSAHAAGMASVAVPNPHYPPAQDALSLAALTVNSIAEVTPELVQGLAP